MQDPEKVFDEGRKAFRDGVEMSAEFISYPRDSDEYYKWVQGWNFESQSK